MSESDIEPPTKSVTLGENTHISVYGRIRPSKNISKHSYNLNENLTSVTFNIPKDISAGYVNHKKEKYTYQLNHIFDEETTQEQIFDGIAKNVVHNVLNGFNGTIFAYGQTVN
jgi:kinesin family protein 6/9